MNIQKKLWPFHITSNALEFGKKVYVDEMLEHGKIPQQQTGMVLLTIFTTRLKTRTKKIKIARNTAWIEHAAWKKPNYLKRS